MGFVLSLCCILEEDLLFGTLLYVWELLGNPEYIEKKEKYYNLNLAELWGCCIVWVGDFFSFSMVSSTFTLFVIFARLFVICSVNQHSQYLFFFSLAHL